MNSRWLHEYSIQTVLASMQFVVILFGFMATGLILKGAGYPDIGFPINGRTLFVRHYRAVFLIVPVIWVFATIALEGRPENRFTKRWSFVTGAMLLAGLTYFYFLAAAGATSIDAGPIQSSE